MAGQSGLRTDQGALISSKWHVYRRRLLKFGGTATQDPLRAITHNARGINAIGIPVTNNWRIGWQPKRESENRGISLGDHGDDNVIADLRRFLYVRVAQDPTTGAEDANVVEPIAIPITNHRQISRLTESFITRCTAGNLPKPLAGTVNPDISPAVTVDVADHRHIANLTTPGGFGLPARVAQDRRGTKPLTGLVATRSR